MKEILQDPDPRLLEVSEHVKEIDASIRELGAELVAILEKPNCAGIAAIQIGVKLRVIGVNWGSERLVVVNPEIIKWSDQISKGYEACLSIDYGETLYGVQRHKRVKVGGLSLDGRVISYKGTGLFAVVLQHEVDHLDGILICNKGR